MMPTALRLLILEDEPNDAELEIAELEGFGYSCQWKRVETREDFLVCLDSPDYDLILSDYNLPQFDGLTALSLVVERKIDIPFILVSGTLGEEEAIESLKAGATDYVLKTRLSRLGPVVQRALKELEELQERQQAELALRESEERFKSIAESMSDWIWEVDINGAYTYCSSQVEAVLGYRVDELIGKTPLDLMSTDEAKRVGPIFSEIFKDKRAFRDLENWNISKEGQRVCLLTSGLPIFSDEGEFLGYRGVDADITERKQVEAEKDRLLAAIDQAAECIVITDPEGTIQYVNPAFGRITGYAREEIIGQNPRILKSGVQDDAFYQTMWKTLLSGETWRGRFSNLKKDGSVYIEEATISPVKDSAGTVINYVGIKADITADLAREEQVRQIQKMESIGRLAGGVAHDFNNILQTIMGFCGLILAETDVQSAQRKDVVEIRKAALLAGDLTQQLLAFSREQPTACRVLDLNKIFADAANMLHQALDDSFQFNFKPETGLSQVKVDASQILQIAMNLVVNARDAMPEGGAITLQTKSIEITPENLSAWPHSREGKWVCFSVTDTGCGMDDNQLVHLFEPFFTTKKLGEGTGLGLSVVYGIVEEHRGWLSVDSELGIGTVFRVCLPVHDAVEPTQGDGSTDQGAFLGKRILLVEDDPVVRELTTEILQDIGYGVLAAADSSEAERLFAEGDGIDMLFSNVVLPGRSGIELAESCLKQQPELSVLLFSGQTDERAQMNLIREKGFNFIHKPFNLKRLLGAVDRTITGRRVE